MDLGYNSAGELFSIGTFGPDSIDVDPGSGTMWLSPGSNVNLFLIKYGLDNEVLWAFALGDTASMTEAKLVPDLAGGVYITGVFSFGSFDIDPGPNSTIMTANGTVNNMFLAHFDATGSLLWAFDTGAAFAFIFPRDITIDGNENVLLTGAFGAGNNLGIDMDPGPGVAELHSFNQTDDNVFIAKYDPSGQHLWSFRIGGVAEFEKGTGVACDVDGNVTLTGVINSMNVDLDPGPDQFIVNAPNNRRHMLLASYDPNGAFRWGGAIGVASNGSGVEANDVVAASDGGVITTGYFSGDSIDFDISTAQSLFSGNAVFVAKYSSLGQLEWLAPMQGVGNYVGEGLALAKMDDDATVVVGRFLSDSLHMSFGGPWLSRVGEFDGFVAKFDGDGDFLDAFGTHSSAIAQNWCVSTFGTQRFAVAGLFTGVDLDLDPDGANPNCATTGSANTGFLAWYGNIGTSIAQQNTPDGPALFPNPISPGQHVDWDDQGKSFNWRLVAMDGSNIMSGNEQELANFQFNGIAPGIYLFMTCNSAGKTRVQQLGVLE